MTDRMDRIETGITEIGRSISELRSTISTLAEIASVHDRQAAPQIIIQLTPDQLKSLVAEAVTQQLEVHGLIDNPQGEWQPTAVASKLLKRSPDLLHSMRKSGALKKGVHWRLRNSKKVSEKGARFEYHVKNCDDRINALNTLKKIL